MLITFDLDNTLWDVEPVITRAEYALFHWFDEVLPGFSSQFDTRSLAMIRQELKEDVPAMSLPELRVNGYRIALERYGLPIEQVDGIAQSAFELFNEWRQKVDFYPSAVSILSELSDQYSLAVITNGTADIYHKDINIGSLFDFALRADQHGTAKPAAGIFYKAAAKANVDVRDIIHIGDHPTDDVHGVNSVGGRSIWFNRHGARRWLGVWGSDPHAEVHSLLELPDTIGALINK